MIIQSNLLVLSIIVGLLSSIFSHSCTTFFLLCLPPLVIFIEAQKNDEKEIKKAQSENFFFIDGTIDEHSPFFPCF